MFENNRVHKNANIKIRRDKMRRRRRQQQDIEFHYCFIIKNCAGKRRIALTVICGSGGGGQENGA